MNSPAPSRAALVLMCGRSFSGKSTVAGQLALKLDAEIVSLDSINEERGLFGGQGIPVEEWIRTNDEGARRVSRILRAGRPVVVDDTSSPRFLRDSWRALAEDAAVTFVLVYVDAPDQVRRERVLDNRGESKRNDVLDEVMIEHLETFQPPEPDEEYLATSSSAKEMFSLIAAVRLVISHA
jgi:predicted kinase